MSILTVAALQLPLAREDEADNIAAVSTLIEQAAGDHAFPAGEPGVELRSRAPLLLAPDILACSLANHT